MVRTAQMVSSAGGLSATRIMAVTETRCLLLLRADEKSIGQNMQDFLWSQMKWLQTLQPLIYFQFTENFSKSS